MNGDCVSEPGVTLKSLISWRVYSISEGHKEAACRLRYEAVAGEGVG